MNAIDVKDVDGCVVFAEVFVWPNQDIFIVWVWSFVVRSS